MNEDLFCKYIQEGIFEVDPLGRIWRLIDRRTKARCTPRRAEMLCDTGYLHVRVGVGGRYLQAMAHRVVWWHFNGPIPQGLTINHINGDKTCNVPSNLELATYREQMHHAKHVLRLSWGRSGEENSHSKLSNSEVDEIRMLSAQRWKQKDIAAKYGVHQSSVSDIVRGKSRVKNLPTLLPPIVLDVLVGGISPVPSPPHAADET